MGWDRKMQNMRPDKARGVLALLLFCSSSSVYAESPALDKEILVTIGDFAERMCPAIPLEGSSSSTELSGNTKAELNGLIKKMAASGDSGGS